MRMDLHVHTCHSFDCSSSIKDVLESARRAGLDALAITDHDTMSGVIRARELSRDIMIIPGMEISTWKGTHLLGLFLSQEIVSRDIFDIIEEIHAQGGLVVIPHPFRNNSGLMSGCGRNRLYSEEDIQNILGRVDLIEAVNMGCREETLLATHEFLENHQQLTWSAGSDAHVPDQVGTASLDLEVTSANSLEILKKALLSAPRSIRFEAYQSGWTGARQKPSPSRRFVKGLRKSFRWLFGSRSGTKFAEETTY